MELTQTLRNRHSLVRVVLAAGLVIVALQSVRRGRRARSALAGLGAAAVGYSAVTGFDDAVEDLTTDLATETTGEATQMRCVNCGDQIVLGQSRRPNEDHETVHDDCLKTPA